MSTQLLGWWGVPLAIIGGTLRGSVPFLFVSLGECLTEKSGKINLGLEESRFTDSPGNPNPMAPWHLSEFRPDTLA